MINKIIHSQYSLYILASIVPFLAISIFISDLIFSFYSLLFLLYTMKKRFSFIHTNKFYLLFLYFYFVCILSSLLSDNITFSLKTSIFYIRAFFFIGLISYLVEKKPIIKDIFYKSLFITFVVLIIFGLIQASILYNDQSLKDVPNIRLSLFFSDNLKLGSYLSRLFGLLFALYIYRNSKNKLENYSFFLLATFTYVTIFLSGERTAFFFISLFFCLCFFLINNIKLSMKILILFFCLFLITIVTFFNERIKVRMFFDSNNKFEISKNELVIFTPQHTDHYKIAYKMFLSKPFLGHGPNMFRLICNYDKFKNDEKKTGCSPHPHNNYLQLLSETGFLGFLFLAVCLFYISYSILKIFVYNFYKKKNFFNNYNKVLVVTLFITLWPFSPGGNFFNNWILIIYTLPLSFYINEILRNKKNV
jgi:O-antigen ligase